VSVDWETEAKPVLAAVYELVENRRSFGVSSVEVAKELKREHGQVARVMAYLADDGYLKARPVIVQSTSEIATEVEQIEPKTLHALAGWPAPGGQDATAQLVAAIEDLMAKASPEERTKLEKLRDAALTVSSSTLAQVLAKVATGAL
jgi:DNA-binding transcriptional MocR family regulator